MGNDCLSQGEEGKRAEKPICSLLAQSELVKKKVGKSDKDEPFESLVKVGFWPLKRLLKCQKSHRIWLIMIHSRLDF